jgi:hypothetical protein
LRGNIRYAEGLILAVKRLKKRENQIMPFNIGLTLVPSNAVTAIRSTITRL